jgi:hypothetical protein
VVKLRSDDDQRLRRLDRQTDTRPMFDALPQMRWNSVQITTSLSTFSFIVVVEGLFIRSISLDLPRFHLSAIYPITASSSFL